jgi:hypothetical protein
MKNFIKLFGPIALAVVIGFSAAGYVSAQAIGNVGDYSDFLSQAPFRDGVFKNPAYEEVNAKFPMAFKLLMGTDGKVFGSFYTYRQIYLDAEKALVEGTTTDANADMFKMAYAYEMLSCIGDFYVSKKKLKNASDESIDNQVLKRMVSERVQAEPAELWRFLLFASKTYLPAADDFKSRVAYANKNIVKSGDNSAVALAKWGFVYKIFNEYREGKHADKKVK